MRTCTATSTQDTDVTTIYYEKTLIPEAPSIAHYKKVCTIQRRSSGLIRILVTIISANTTVKPIFGRQIRIDDLTKQLE